MDSDPPNSKALPSSTNNGLGRRIDAASTVLYMDDDICIVNKPASAGIPVQSHESNCAENVPRCLERALGAGPLKVFAESSHLPCISQASLVPPVPGFKVVRARQHAPFMASQYFSPVSQHVRSAGVSQVPAPDECMCCADAA